MRITRVAHWVETRGCVPSQRRSWALARCMLLDSTRTSQCKYRLQHWQYRRASVRISKASSNDAYLSDHRVRLCWSRTFEVGHAMDRRERGGRAGRASVPSLMSQVV